MGCVLFHHAAESSMLGGYTGPAAVGGRATSPISDQAGDGMASCGSGFGVRRQRSGKAQAGRLECTWRSWAAAGGFEGASVGDGPADRATLWNGRCHTLALGLEAGADPRTEGASARQKHCAPPESAAGTLATPVPDHALAPTLRHQSWSCRPGALLRTACCWMGE